MAIIYFLLGALVFWLGQALPFDLFGNDEEDNGENPYAVPNGTAHTAIYPSAPEAVRLSRDLHAFMTYTGDTPKAEKESEEG
ncbi:MAG: hypothetical protein FWF49_02295 [Oscillospiraceae bacterium]|nr:hypothetical protein [Oscillospiraceae bacterium]